MKKTILLSALLFFTINFYGQKEANIWYFGDKAGLDFNSGTPQVITGSQMNTLEGCATISDDTGSFFFIRLFSDYEPIKDRPDTVM